MPYNRQCKVTLVQLTNRNDVVKSVGDGPIGTTAGTTTDKEAWESLWLMRRFDSFPSSVTSPLKRPYNIMEALKWVVGFKLKTTLR